MVRAFSILGASALGAAVVQERRRRQRAERFAAAAMESLLRAIDANDPQTGAHVRRVAAYALILAEFLGLDDDTARTIELAALFHDVGKIHEALFDIVHEPRTLTVAERRAIATHPERGADVLAPIAHFHPQLAEAVLSHHERWDGAGYPRRLRGNRIPLAARVVAIADSFDAITHRRRYRDGRTAEAAVTALLRGRGSQFDPELVDLMLLPPVLERITRVLRAEQRGARRRPVRGESHGVEAAPKIEIRWRTRSASPAPVERQLGEARATV